MRQFSWTQRSLLLLMFLKQDGLLDTSDLFYMDTSDYMVSVLGAQWQAIVTGQICLEFNLKLSSAGFNLCQLGDFIAFLISHMALHAGGRLLAYGMKCVSSFAEWFAGTLGRSR